MSNESSRYTSARSFESHRIYTDFAEEEITSESESRSSGSADHKGTSTVDTHPRALSPISSNTMNALSGAHTVSADTQTKSMNGNGTIRTVPAEDLHITSSDNSNHSDETRRVMPHSTTLSYIPHSQPPLTHQNPGLGPGQGGLVRAMSTEFGGSASGNGSANTNGNSNGNAAANGNGNGNADNGWSSAVGRANLGKSGRVIEKLMADKDTLRRELNVERLKAAESREAVKNLQEQMQQAAEANNGKLHEAAVNKTLLRRKERQVDELTVEIEAVKKRCREAQEREQQWKDEAERVRLESMEKVEEAKLYAAMMDGRVNTMANHWKDQEKVANRAVESVKREIQVIVEQRRDDDKKIGMLQTVCEQQDWQLEELRRQNREIQKKFEEYKKEQERGLMDIKETARAQMDRNEELIGKSKETLGELRWALKVKENVKGAM